MKSYMGYVFVGVLLSAFIIYALVNEQWRLLVELGSLVVGMGVGDLLMRGAYKLLGGGESTWRLIAWGVGIGGALLWLVLLVVPPARALVDAAVSFGILGFTIRAVARAIAISTHLRTEDRRP